MLGQDWKLRFRQEEQAKAQPVVQGVEPALGFRPLARPPKGSEWVSSQLHTGVRSWESLGMAVVGVFTPQEVAAATNQSWLSNVDQQATGWPLDPNSLLSHPGTRPG